MTRLASLLGLVALATCICACSEATEQHTVALAARPLTVQPGFQDQLVLHGLTQPTAVRFAKDISKHTGLTPDDL